MNSLSVTEPGDADLGDVALLARPQRRARGGAFAVLPGAVIVSATTAANWCQPPAETSTAVTVSIEAFEERHMGARFTPPAREDWINDSPTWRHPGVEALAARGFRRINDPRQR